MGNFINKCMEVYASADDRVKILLLVCIGLFALWIVLEIYGVVYFWGFGFRKIKKTVQGHIEECNEMNRHFDRADWSRI